MFQSRVHAESHASGQPNGAQVADRDIFEPGTDLPGPPSRLRSLGWHITVPDGMSPPHAHGSVGSLKTEQFCVNGGLDGSWQVGSRRLLLSHLASRVWLLGSTRESRNRADSALAIHGPRPATEQPLAPPRAGMDMTFAHGRSMDSLGIRRR